jgi:hypothetical protein
MYLCVKGIGFNSFYYLFYVGTVPSVWYDLLLVLFSFNRHYMSNDLKDSLCVSTRGYRHYMSNDLKDSLCISTRGYFIKMIEYSYQSTNVVLLQS